jgi:hypothetical protein
MFSCLNTSARVNVLYRPMKTEIEDYFSSMAFSICFTVKLYEKRRLLTFRTTLLAKINVIIITNGEQVMDQLTE